VGTGSFYVTAVDIAGKESAPSNLVDAGVIIPTDPTNPVVPNEPNVPAQPNKPTDPTTTP